MNLRRWHTGMAWHGLKTGKLGFHEREQPKRSQCQPTSLYPPRATVTVHRHRTNAIPRQRVCAHDMHCTGLGTLVYCLCRGNVGLLFVPWPQPSIVLAGHTSLESPPWASHFPYPCLRSVPLWPWPLPRTLRISNTRILGIKNTFAGRFSAEVYARLERRANTPHVWCS